MAEKALNKFVTFCPKCNSTDISTDFSNPALVSTGLFNNAKVCNNCGYSANFFPEVETENLSPTKQIKEVGKRDFVNTTYGSNILWWWRFLGSFGILLSIASIFTYNFEKLFFYAGLIELLPLSCMFTLAAYRNDLMRKYRALQIISISVYVYAATLAPGVILHLLNVF